MIKQKADFYDQLNAQKADFELRFQKNDRVYAQEL